MSTDDNESTFTPAPGDTAKLTEPGYRWRGAAELLPMIVPIQGLELYGANPRKRGDRNVRGIRLSFESFGQVKPVVVYRFPDHHADTVIAGNGGLLAARELGWSHLARTTFEGTPDEAEAYAIADNATQESSAWDRELLKVQAIRMQATEKFRALYDTLGIRRHVGDKAPEKADDVGSVPERATTLAGDVWILGRHRLVCGDTFQHEARQLLLGDRMADMVLTDPPFAIYGSSTGIGRDIADDKMVRPFFTEMFRAVAERARLFAHVYIHCDWRSWPAIVDVAKRLDVVVKNCLVWDKGHFGMGGMYGNAHEFVGFFARLPPARTMVADERKGLRNVFGKPNILRYARVSGDEREHNAAKPVELLMDLIENSSEPGESVLDFFGGSGSTLLAAERTGRACYMMETEPKWCDVIVRRWQNETKSVATLEATGAPFGADR